MLHRCRKVFIPKEQSVIYERTELHSLVFYFLNPMPFQVMHEDQLPQSFKDCKHHLYKQVRCHMSVSFCHFFVVLYLFYIRDKYVFCSDKDRLCLHSGEQQWRPAVLLQQGFKFFTLLYFYFRV